MKKSIILIFVLFLLVGCSSDDTESDEISNKNLQGTVYGMDFIAAGGKAFTSGDDLSVNITNEIVGCSSTIFDYNLYVTTYITPVIGVYNDINVVFHENSEAPFNYLSSTVEVVEVTSEVITVKILANSSSDNSVSGVFTVLICD